MVGVSHLPLTPQRNKTRPGGPGPDACSSRAPPVAAVQTRLPHPPLAGAAYSEAAQLSLSATWRAQGCHPPAGSKRTFPGGGLVAAAPVSALQALASLPPVDPPRVPTLRPYLTPIHPRRLCQAPNALHGWLVASRMCCTSPCPSQARTCSTLAMRTTYCASLVRSLQLPEGQIVSHPSPHDLRAIPLFISPQE